MRGKRKIVPNRLQGMTPRREADRNSYYEPRQAVADQVNDGSRLKAPRPGSGFLLFFRI